MKTYKTYIRTILPLFVVLGLVGSAQAQSATDAAETMTATASVVAGITLTNNGNVNFGQIAASTLNEVFLDPTGASSNEVGANSSTGKFTVGGSPNATIIVSYSATVPMTPAGGGTNLTWAPSVTGNTTDNASGSSAIAADGSTSGLALNSNTSAEYHIYVGGRLYEVDGQALTSVDPDTYTGTMTLNVAYN